jgi:hypothetical protein
MKRVARVARRYLVIDKMSRRQRHPSSTSTTTATTSSQRPRQQQQQQFLLSDDEDDVDLIREVDSPVHLARSLEQQVLDDCRNSESDPEVNPISLRFSLFSDFCC